MESKIKKVWKKGIMDCDCCNARDLNEIFILREKKFARIATKAEKKYRRVCWTCARMLFRKMIYNFGHNWRCVFLDASLIAERNKYKCMVIHQ